jgi:hypothetical protein
MRGANRLNVACRCVTFGSTSKAWISMKLVEPASGEYHSDDGAPEAMCETRRAAPCILGSDTF